MLVGPIRQEDWTRSSQREPARSNIHTSTTASRQKRPVATVGYKELNESGEFVIPGFAKMSRL
jgi:hypothetical protein